MNSSSPSGLANLHGNDINNINYNQCKPVVYSRNSSPPAYITVKVEDRSINCLVDTGATMSICCQSILPKSGRLEVSNIKLNGVTGNSLNVLGTTRLNLDFGSISKQIDLVVVDNMKNNVMILGRDFLSQHDCIINYRRLSFKIDDQELPIIKPSKSSHNDVFQVISPKTYCIKGKSSIIIPGRVYSRNARSKSDKDRSYISLTGIVNPAKNLCRKGLLAWNALSNVHRGIVDMVLHNDSDHDIMVYKNIRLGSLSTIDINFISSTNACFGETYGHSKSPEPNSFPENKNPKVQRERWQGQNIENLYNILKLQDLTHLSQTQLDQVKALVVKFKNFFSEGEDDIGCTDIMKQHIVLDTNVPIRAKYRNIPLQYREAAEREVDRLMKLGIIQPSSSPYHSPSFIMKRPDGAGYRILTDFRELNKHVVRSFQPIPSLETMSACWKGCKYYSKMDLIKGFYQSDLTDSSTQYTATIIPGIAFFEYRKSPLGLSSSPCFFQSLVEKMTMGLKGSVCTCYLDDILSASPTFEGMIENLTKVFSRIEDSKMLLSPKKVDIFRKRLNF